MLYLVRQPNGLFAYFDSIQARFEFHSATKERTASLMRACGWNVHEIPTMIEDAEHDRDLTSRKAGKGCDRWVESWTDYVRQSSDPWDDQIAALLAMVTPLPPPTPPAEPPGPVDVYAVGARVRVAITRDRRQVGESNGTLLSWRWSSDDPTVPRTGRGRVYLDLTRAPVELTDRAILGPAKEDPTAPPPPADVYDDPVPGLVSDPGLVFYDEQVRDPDAYERVRDRLLRRRRRRRPFRPPFRPRP